MTIQLKWNVWFQEILTYRLLEAKMEFSEGWGEGREVFKPKTFSERGMDIFCIDKINLYGQVTSNIIQL